MRARSVTIARGAMQDLPVELLERVFLFLTPEQDYVLEQVCGRWRALVWQWRPRRRWNGIRSPVPLSVALQTPATLRWAHKRGLQRANDVCLLAATWGRLAVLKQARALQYPWDEQVCLCAAEHGHWQVLDWADQAGCPLSEHAMVAIAAIEANHRPNASPPHAITY